MRQEMNQGLPAPLTAANLGSRAARTQSNVPTRPAIAIRSLPDSYRAWCEPCGEVVSALEADSAAEVMHISPADLADLLTAGKLHFVEADAKSPLMCGNAILTNPTEV
jgi:hypothetical protein